MEKEKSDREKIFGDRKRTNILKALEQPAIQFLLKIVPKFVTPNLMTAVGMFGSVVVLAAFILAKKQEPLFLLLGILGLFINWIGDSLDGRLAYYRNIARKWYGFALDIIMDWLSIILIGLGYYFYASEPYKILAFPIRCILWLVYNYCAASLQNNWKLSNRLWLGWADRTSCNYRFDFNLGNHF